MTNKEKIIEIKKQLTNALGKNMTDRMMPDSINNQTKYTPAPWHVGDTNKNFDAMVYGKDGLMIANCTKVRGRSIEEEDANAQLIAAAPELLEALKKIVKCEINRMNDLETLSTKPKSLYTFSKARVEKAQAAINKAEGK